MATSSSNSLEQLSGVYKTVVDDVIRGVREEFLNEAVDLEVLEDLKRIWLNKLSLSGAVNRPTQSDILPKPTSTDPKPSSSKQQAQSSSTPKPILPSLPPPLVPVQQPAPIPTFPLPPSLISSQGSTHAERDSVTVIHHAPARSQSPPTTITAAHSSSPSQASIMLHPSMIAAISGETGSTATSQAMPTLLQPSLGAFQQGMVPIPTAQGTVLVPLSHLVALNQKAAPVSQNSASTSKEKDVQQIDGYPPSPSCSNLPRPPPADQALDSLVSSPQMLTGLPMYVSSQESHNLFSKPISSSESSKNNDGEKCSSLEKEFSLGQGLPHSRRRARNFPVPGDTVEFVYTSDQADGVTRCSGSKERRGFIVQLDGGLGNSSSEEDSDLDDDSSDDDAGGTEEQAPDDDPLNSEDDVDDDEQEGKDFDTNDTIVCLWEKVYRVRTKWKFLMKDGIMHLGGYDYVFQKGTGEADW